MSDHSKHSLEFHEHIVPVSTYLAVFISLLILTALTTGVAYVDMGGAWNTVVALAIAVGKMMLVVLFFMHVKYHKGLTRIVVVAALFWLGIMMTFTLSDELTRHWEIYPQGWVSMIVLFSRHLLF